jgi:glycine/D-amino acid oxidase-like deaminating enzyme
MTTLPDESAATDPESPLDHDVIVVGGGASGLSAAVFLARYGLQTLVLARGKSAIHQCAHLENYLGFPGGLSPERFVKLGRTHAEHEGATVVEDLVERVERDDHGFRVETQDGRVLVTRYVVVASAYDGAYLDGFRDELGHDDEGPFVATDAGRTPVEGLYATGWLTDDTIHQAVVNAGDGARAALTLARDEMSDRYWPAVGERYVDWVVDDGRYGGDGWAAHVDEWFDREIVPDDHDLGVASVEEARADLKAEFLGRCIDEAERQRRDYEGQWKLLEQLDAAVVREYAETLGEDESSTTNRDTEPIARNETR